MKKITLKIQKLFKKKGSDRNLTLPILFFFLLKAKRFYQHK